MRYAVPVVNRRGAGLGNELILWAKAFISGQALNMRALHPAWGINRRRYWRYFQTSRLDYIEHQVLRRALPTVRFGEDDYLRHGGDDFADAFLSFARERDIMERTPLVLEVDGLWGGPGMLTLAREFIRGQLLRTRWAADNLYTVDRRVGNTRLRVGVHIRRGDFAAPLEPGEYAGKFNLALPLSWYEAIMTELHRAFGERIVFVIATDARPEEMVPIIKRFPCVTTLDIPNCDVSDLLCLASTEFLICSISSFSLWAALLGRMPYAWYSPQLSSFNGTRSIWGHLPRQQHPNSPLGHARAAVTKGTGLGYAIDEDGRLPDALLSQLEQAVAQVSRTSDLIRYGVITE